MARNFNRDIETEALLGCHISLVRQRFSSIQSTWQPRNVSANTDTNVFFNDFAFVVLQIELL